MSNKTFKKAKYLFLLIFAAFSIIKTANGQLLVGPKLGGQVSWVNLNDDTNLDDFMESKPTLGYNGGFMVAFKVGKRYYLQTEYIYSRKGKKFEGITDPSLEFNQVQHHFDLPILYRVDFKSSLFNLPSFKYYLGIGPNISYWWRSNGELKAAELFEDEIPALEYDVSFNEEDRGAPDKLYVPKANRIQLGVNFAAGMLLEPQSGNTFLFEVRYELGHSNLAQEDFARFAEVVEFVDPLRVRNNGFRLSFAYLIDTKISESKKGKSNFKKRNR